MAAPYLGKQIRLIKEELDDYAQGAASQAQEYAGAAATSVAAVKIQAFDKLVWDTPITLRNEDINTPATGLTSDVEGISAANAGRLYAVPTIASLGLAVDDTVRVAFQRISGTSQPASFTFRNGTTLISSVNFTLVGDWYVAEAVIPATTTIIRLDWTNASGSVAKITRPRFAKKGGLVDLPLSLRTQIEALASDSAGLANLWPGVAQVAKLSGAGAGTATINADGTVTVPVDYNASIRSSTSIATIIRNVGANLTILAKLSSPLVRQVSALFIGDISGTTAVLMRAIGDGWWYWSGAIPAITGSTAIGNLHIQVDNREPSGSYAGYVSGNVTVGPVIVVDGLNIPQRLPAPATTIYPDDEVVVTQASNLLYVHQRAGEPGQYIRWKFERYNNSGIRALGWRISLLTTATRSGDTAFTQSIVLSDNGEFEFAVKESGKSDFMGGLTHGDMEEERVITVIVDGKKITPDGSTSYRARRVEAIQKSKLWEVDNGTNTLTGTLVTRWLWERGELRLSHRLVWARSINVTTPYLAMLPLLRGTSSIISGTALLGPTFDSFDISVAGHGMTKANRQRIITLGDVGVKVDMEVVKGWTSSSTSFLEDSALPVRNKMYFSPVSIDATTTVTAGDVWEFETVYRIGVSAYT